jgi:hypothetical protein
MNSTAIGDTRIGSFSADIAIPVCKLVPSAIFSAVIAAVLFYFVSTEQGALSLFPGMYVHEFVHDGRHLLGFPCH